MKSLAVLALFALMPAPAAAWDKSDVPPACGMLSDPQAERECGQAWMDSCHEDPRLDDCKAWKERFTPLRDSGNREKSKSAAQELKTEKRPEGCVHQMGDLKKAESKATVDRLKNVVGGWNELVGSWALDPTTANLANASANAVFDGTGGSLKGKIVQRSEGSSEVTNNQSRPIALCENNGRLEIWALDSADPQKGAAIAFINRNRAKEVELVPLAGEHKDRYLVFRKENAAGGGAVGGRR